MQLQTKSFDKIRSKIQSVNLAARLVPTAKFKDLPKEQKNISFEEQIFNTLKI